MDFVLIASRFHVFAAERRIRFPSHLMPANVLFPKQKLPQITSSEALFMFHVCAANL